ncbi:ETX/MTX2 family pore-forming toxin [Virgibacillus chiguensis]|uniref:Toxin ETX/toxin MTX2 n=1 Tax=Virgibacillus chiguensis TaxID=411959 RepID=A0A1M5WRR1_9BACI|nr:ETX/MTX2 family pore-forming toxin [Virgibacillus chiguensis]SHH89794.1 toxin ETX/toxin MTX2 [Virgibacillus chiguensis]
MAIYNLNDAIIGAASEWGLVDLYILLENNVILTEAQLDLPDNRIISTKPGRTIIAKKEITNTTDRPTQQQIVVFERKTENTFSTKTTEGFEYGVQIDVKANIDVVFTQLDTTISTSFKYNTSTEKTQETTETITWREEIPVIVPPRTRTIIEFDITLGDFDQVVTFAQSLEGTLRFTKLFSGQRITATLTQQNSNGDTIANIMKQKYGIPITIIDDKVLLDGDVRLSGSLGILSNTTITNQPLPGNPLPKTVETIPGQQASRAVFF